MQAGPQEPVVGLLLGWITRGEAGSRGVTAYEFATGHRLASADFEGGRAGAVKVLEGLGFTIQAIRRSAT